MSPTRPKQSDRGSESDKSTDKSTEPKKGTPAPRVLNASSSSSSQYESGSSSQESNHGTDSSSRSERDHLGSSADSQDVPSHLDDGTQLPGMLNASAPDGLESLPSRDASDAAAAEKAIVNETHAKFDEMNSRVQQSNADTEARVQEAVAQMKRHGSV